MYGKDLVSSINLTLTRVVFESVFFYLGTYGAVYLTLTRVVFEY